MDPKTIGGLNLYGYCLNNPVMYVDPSGTFCFIGFIIGAIIGAAIGFGAVAYMDYQDDGEIFNGSIGWQAYLGGALFGGAVGGLLGGFLIPALSHMSFSIPTGFKLVTDSIGGMHMVVASSITITGGQVIMGAGVLGLCYMFYKEHSSNKRKSNLNKHQQGQARRNQDNRGEKGDYRRRPNPNKRPINIILLILSLLDGDENGF